VALALSSARSRVGTRPTTGDIGTGSEPSTGTTRTCATIVCCVTPATSGLGQNHTACLRVRVFHSPFSSSFQMIPFLRLSLNLPFHPTPPPMTDNIWFDLCSAALARPITTQLLLLRVVYGSLITLSAASATAAAFVAYRHRKFKRSPGNDIQATVWPNFPWFISLVFAASCASCTVWSVYVGYLSSFFQLKSDALDHSGPQYVLSLSCFCFNVSRASVNRNIM
jgi:hypothetical protein